MLLTTYLLCARGHNMSGRSDGRSDDLLRHVAHFNIIYSNNSVIIQSSLASLNLLDISQSSHGHHVSVTSLPASTVLVAVDISGTQRWYSSYLAWATNPMLPALSVA